MKNFKPIVNLITERGKSQAFFLAALCFLSVQQISAQRTPLPTPKPNTTATPKIYTPRPRPNPVPPKPSESKRVVMNEGDTPAEKSIATESSVKIALCVKSGSVRINGWDRNEIRGYIENGSQIGFKVVQKDPKTGKPVWVKPVGYDPVKNKELNPEDCLSGSNIELDVPRGATIELKSERSEIKIESVGRVVVKTLKGNIFLNDVANGIEAITYLGDITVEKSSGQMILDNNGDGNILAIDVAPREIGDVFKAATDSGRMTLQDVEHRQIDTNSTSSGSISFDGELLSGGQYGFSVNNGSIVLAVPPTSLCKINASFGFGAFSSDIPLKNVLKKEKNISAQFGDDDATCNISLKTASGVIRIKRRNSSAVEKTRAKLEKSVKPVDVQTTTRVDLQTTTKMNVSTTAQVSVAKPKVTARKAKKRR